MHGELERWGRRLERFTWPRTFFPLCAGTSSHSGSRSKGLLVLAVHLLPVGRGELRDVCCFWYLHLNNDFRLRCCPQIVSVGNRKGKFFIRMYSLVNNFINESSSDDISRAWDVVRTVQYPSITCHRTKCTSSSISSTTSGLTALTPQ